MRIVKLNDITEIILAKNEIENKLITDGKIENSMQLSEFIDFLKMQDKIFIKSDTVIPFSIIYDILFLPEYNEYNDELIQILEDINYNLDSLQEVPVKDVYSGSLELEDFYFIVNSKYKIKK